MTGFPSVDIWLPFLAIAAVAGYFQTVAGFGMGMIIIAATSSLGLIPVAVVASIINILSMTNSAVALPGRFDHIRWRKAGWVLVASLPATLAGVVLLGAMGTGAANILRLLLGLAIIGGGISILLKPSGCASVSGGGSFMASGAISGLVGGMFGIFGPPLIYQFYRQPLELITIRNMLIMLFAVMAALRLLLIGLRGELAAGVLILSGLAIPVIALATIGGRKFPPPLSPTVMRGVVFVVLVGLGAKLFGSAAFSLAM